MTTKNRNIESLQCLRAVAATMVVAVHVLDFMGKRFNLSEPNELLLLISRFGAAGVDIFFVISGFIMFHTTQSMPAGFGSVKTFWTRRLIRIVPMYWILTALILVAFLTGLSSEKSGIDIGATVKSLLFIPLTNSEGNMRPVLGVGWTLIYEMYFYLWFGISCLLSRERRAIFLVGTLGASVVVGSMASIHFDSIIYKTYTDPIIVEFLIGVLVGVIFNAKSEMKMLPWQFILPEIAGWYLLVNPSDGVENLGPYSRLIAQGIPAAVIVTSLLFMERSATGGWSRIPGISMIGDASYSLYLVHPIIILVFSFISRPFRGVSVNWPGLTLLALLGIIAIFSILLYLLLEKGLTSKLQQYYLK